MKQARHLFPALLVTPLVACMLVLFVVPAAQLGWAGAHGPQGWGAYGVALVSVRHLASLGVTTGLAGLAVVLGLGLGVPVGVFLARSAFPGRGMLLALLTLPASFPGVVVGFMVILLAGRQGLVGHVTLALAGHRVAFAYAPAGLVSGYVYFSIPRVIATVAASAARLDPAPEDAARSLGAAPWQVARDITLPALMPAIGNAAAITFATAMSAFGTAYTLGADIKVLPLMIYDDFATSANLPAATAYSFLLGGTTCLVLALAARLGRRP